MTLLTKLLIGSAASLGALLIFTTPEQRLHAALPSPTPPKPPNPQPPSPSKIPQIPEFKIVSNLPIGTIVTVKASPAVPGNPDIKAGEYLVQEKYQLPPTPISQIPGRWRYKGLLQGTTERNVFGEEHITKVTRFPPSPI